MNYYETYASNIQVINEIINKTFIEFNFDIYNQVLRKINKISPEYLDENSDLISNTDYLFSLSNNLINTMNQEIIEINNYIASYTKEYINKNKYYLD